MFVPDFVYSKYANTISQLASERRLPVIFLSADPVLAGGLMSYGSDVSAQHRQAGVYAGKLLKGATPAELPVDVTSRYEMVVNMRAASELGLRLPDALLVRANRLIE